MDFENNVPYQESPAEVQAPENFVMGVIGALIGALLGAASIILLSQLGYIAAISGVILALCTLKGYELLGKNLSRKGIVVCVILMLITPFIADWIDWAIYLKRELGDYGMSLMDCCVLMVDMLKAGYVEMGEYLKNLGMIYLFVVMGAAGILKSAFKK